MLTRREFIAGAAKVLAGGVAAASGVLAIVPAEAEAVHPGPVHPLSEAWIEAGKIMMDGMIEGIDKATAGPIKNTEFEITSILSADMHYELGDKVRLRWDNNEYAGIVTSVTDEEVTFENARVFLD